MGSEAPKRLPCPFCGSRIAHVGHDKTLGLSFVLCDNCRASSGHTNSDEQAVELWNRRAEAAVSREADAVGAAGAGKTQCFDCKATMYPDAGRIWSYQCVDGRCRCPDCYDEWYPRWKAAAATGAASGEAAEPGCQHQWTCDDAGGPTYCVMCLCDKPGEAADLRELLAVRRLLWERALENDRGFLSPRVEAALSADDALLAALVERVER